MLQLRSISILSVLILISFIPQADAQKQPGTQTRARTSSSSRVSATPPAGKPSDAYLAVDKKALAVPDSSTRTPEGIAAYIGANFSDDKDKVRAVFIWIASNIEYDIANMFAINFYAKKEEMIMKPLQTRKGICSNYAYLFTDVCTKAGIQSFVVEGYTKQQGFTAYIPHAWSAAYIGNSWLLFDPTWGSGYVNGAKFYKRIDNSYFMVQPSVLIRTHMPFDYLWQFLHYPVTNQEFYEEKTQENRSKPYFSYPDSIAAYEKLSDTAACAAAAWRIEKNGIKNGMIFDRLHHLKSELELARQNAEIDRQNRIVALYNSAINDNNQAIRSFNIFIDYYNKQFKPPRPDPEIQAMLDESASHLKDATAKLDEITNPGPNIASQLNSFRSQIAELQGRVDEQQAWLKKYLAKGKSGRKGMFTTLTWFGIPLK